MQNLRLLLPSGDIDAHNGFSVMINNMKNLKILEIDIGALSADKEAEAC